MRETRVTEAGETLLEIVIALIVISIVFGAFFAAYSTAAGTSTTHRAAAQTDAILRQAAEATKDAVRDQCADNTASKPPSATYTTVPISVPPGFTGPTASPSGQTCPPVTGTRKVTFSVKAPGAASRTLTIEVRTP